MLKLKNQTVSAKVRPYEVAIGSVMTVEEHDALHNIDSEIPSSQFPHSSFFHPIHERLDDDDSPIVGFIGGGAAWDRSLVRNVLPESVSGLYAIIRNNCNQSYTYEIVGKKAFYRGVGDLYETKYDDLEVAVGLSEYSHADAVSTPGHCQFSLVSSVSSIICSRNIALSNLLLSPIIDCSTSTQAMSSRPAMKTPLPRSSLPSLLQPSESSF